MKHKWIWWILGGLAVLYIDHQPKQAANTAHGIGDWISKFADHVATFLSHLFS